MCLCARCARCPHPLTPTLLSTVSVPSLPTSTSCCQVSLCLCLSLPSSPLYPGPAATAQPEDLIHVLSNEVIPWVCGGAR